MYIKTILRNIVIMNKLKYAIPGRILKAFYCILIQPYLSYGILIWEVHANRISISLLYFNTYGFQQSLQKPYWTFILPNVIFCYTYVHPQLGAFVYRFSSIRNLPVVFKEYFTKCSEIHDYPTRHDNDLNLTNNKKYFPIMLFERVIPFFGTHYQNP